MFYAVEVGQPKVWCALLTKNTSGFSIIVTQQIYLETILWWHLCNEGASKQIVVQLGPSVATLYLPVYIFKSIKPHFSPWIAQVTWKPTKIVDVVYSLGYNGWSHFISTGKEVERGKQKKKNSKHLIIISNPLNDQWLTKRSHETIVNQRVLKCLGGFKKSLIAPHGKYDCFWKL